MDVFSETLVRRKLTPDIKKKVMIIFFSLIFSSIIFILVIPLLALSRGLAYVSTVSLAIFALIVFFLWRTLKNYQLEFEYIITNGTLDIDKIIARKKRVRLISFELKDAEDIGIYNQSNPYKNFDTVISAERNTLYSGNLFISIHHPELKNTLVVISPDDKMLAALSKTLPRGLISKLPSAE